MKFALKKAVASILSAAIFAGGVFSVSAAEGLFEAERQSSVEITFPATESDKTVVGNDGIEIIGNAAGESSLTVTVNGKKGQTVAVSSDGSFSAKVGAFLLTAGLNDIEISPQSGKDGQSLVVKKQYYYDIADFEHGISDAAESFWQQGVSRYCGELSVGGQTLKTNNGFCLRPLDGEDAAEAKVTFDLTKTEKPVRFFHSLIGADDFGNVNGTVGSSVVYSVVIDGVTAARSREIGMNETDEISAEIPVGAKELTLCVNNSNGSNHADYADYINPRLFLKSEDYTGTEVSLFSEGTDTELKAKASVSTRLNLKNDFSSVTIAPKKAGEKVFGRLFKFTYSKTRSMQNGALCEAELLPDGQGNYKFTLNDLYGPGEYLFVFDGVTEISAKGSEKGFIYADGAAEKGLFAMKIAFSGKASEPLADPSAEGAPPILSNKATDAEKARAKEVYDTYITDLEKFPSKIKIGDSEYVGFSSGDFTKISQKTETHEVTKSENTEIELLHKSGLTFTLKTVFYPDYAAFDWVIYFTNITAANSPTVTDISPAELKFEGENPVILTSCGDTEAATQSTAPFIPRSFELEETPSLSFCPSSGRSTEVGFPYYNFEYGSRGVLLTTSWAGQWQTDFEYSKGVTSFSGRQQTFNSYLKPGETARTPLTAVILYDGRDTDRAVNLWRRWMIDCNMYKKDGKTNLEPFVAGLPKEVMYQTEDSMIENIELYEKLGVGIDYWWIDAGWYVDGNTRNWTHVGNWTVDTERFPTKLSAVGEACEKAGMRGRIILWFEPERNAFRMNENDFETYGVSKEWLAGYNKEKNTAPGPTNSHIFDLGNKQALAWVTDKIKTVLTEGNMSMYREDFNNAQTLAIWQQINAADPSRSGMTENGEVQGHLALWDSILELDNIEMIDSCASGGHRLDLESMRRAVAIHPTDYNYNDLPAKQQGSYGMSAWFPFTGANTGWGEYHGYTDKYIMRTAYRQSIACQVHLETFDSQTVELLKDCTNEWKGINGYFYGDIYELTKNTVSQNEWYSYSYINDEKEGFAFVFNRGGEYAEKSQNIRLKGLDPNGIYEISFADSEDKITAVGAELMSVGITMTLDENEHGQSVGDSDIVYIKRVSAAVIYGDTDGDGEISVTDALLTLQGSVAKINLTAEQSAAADVDGDGKVTVTDALLILQKSVGKIQSFPVEK